MVDLTFEGIERADALDASAAEQVAECVRVLTSCIAKNNRLDAYRSGNVNMHECMENTSPDVTVEPSCPWGEVAVSSIVERSRFDGFTFRDQDGTAALRMAELTAGRPFGSGYARALRSGVTYGPAFLSVVRTPRGPRVRWHTAKTATGIWDMGEERLECGFAITKTRRVDDFAAPVPVECDLYTEGGLWELTRDSGLGGWKASFMPDPMGEPRMLAMPFMPDDENPFGHTRLSRSVRHMIREYIANAYNLHVASMLYAIGQKAIMGLSRQQFADIKDEKDGLALERVLLGVADKDGNSPHLEQWQQQSMEPLISVKRSLAQDFAAATSVPVSELISQDSNPTSAEALVAAKDKLISLVESVNDANREVLRKAALMIQAIDSECGLDDLTADQLGVSAHFRDPSTPSAAAMADSTLKMAQTIDGYSETDVCLERLGFDEGERYRIQAAQRKRQARLGASAILERNRQVSADADESGGAGALPGAAGRDGI